MSVFAATGFLAPTLIRTFYTYYKKIMMALYGKILPVLHLSGVRPQEAPRGEAVCADPQARQQRRPGGERGHGQGSRRQQGWGRQPVGRAQQPRAETCLLNGGERGSHFPRGLLWTHLLFSPLPMELHNRALLTPCDCSWQRGKTTLATGRQ